MERQRRRSHDAALNSSSLSRATTSTSHRSSRPRGMTFTSRSSPSSSKSEVDNGRSRHHRHNAIDPVTTMNSNSTVHARRTTTSSSSSSSYYYQPRHSSSSDITTSFGSKNKAGPKSGDGGGGGRLRDCSMRTVSSRHATTKRASDIPSSTSATSSHVSSFKPFSSKERTSRSQLPFLHTGMSRTRRSSDVSPSPRSSRRSGRSASSKVMMFSKSCPTLDIPAEDNERNGHVRSFVNRKTMASAAAAPPSVVSFSSQSQTTCPTSPDSSRDSTIACNHPRGIVPSRSTRKVNPPPPSPRPLTRRSSNATRSHNNMGPSSSCPTSNIPVNDEFGNCQGVHNAAVPTAVIYSRNDTDTKSDKQLNNVTKCSRKVSKMAYTDPFGDSGLYTGEVDEESRPHGKGKMKYDNGIYFEGAWYYGCKNDRMGLKNNGISTMGGASTACLQQDGSTRERILSGFTSWKGKKSAADSSSSASSFVYGMDWVDPSGLSGKYTGRVNDADVPDGKGVMRYHFGLIAEGDWMKGVLNTGAGAGVNPLVAGNPGGLSGAMSVVPGMSVAGGGGGGAMSVVSGLGMMSIGGGGALGGMGGFYPPTPSVAAGVYNSMVNPYANMMALMQPTQQVEVRNPAGNVADASFWSSPRCVQNY